jgi:hypothetical protein
MGQRHHVSKACETRQRQRVALPHLLFAPPPPLDFFSPLKKPQACAFVCVASSLFFGRWGVDAYKQKLIFIEKKKESWLAHEDVSTAVDVRGVSVSLSSSLFVSPSRASCTDAACTYPIPPFRPPPLFSLSFLFLFVRGAVLTGTASFFIHCIHIDPAQSKKKFIVPKKIWHRRVHRVSPGADLGRGQMDTRPQTAPRRAHLPGKRPFSIDHDGLRETIILN